MQVRLRSEATTLEITMYRSIRKLFATVALCAVALFTTGPAWAAVEVNSADPSQLESIKGIGPALSGKITTERKQGNFKDWSDFENRVSGVGEKNAAAFSRAGLTVGGKAKDGAQATPDAMRTAKAGAKKPAADGGNSSLAKK